MRFFGSVAAVSVLLAGTVSAEYIATSVSHPCPEASQVAYHHAVEPHHKEPHHKEPHYKKPHHKEPHYDEPHYKEPSYKEPHHKKPSYKEPHHKKPHHKSTKAKPAQSYPHSTPAAVAYHNAVEPSTKAKPSKTYMHTSSAPTATLIPNPYHGTKDGCEVLKPTSSIKFYYSDPSPVPSKPQGVAYVDFNFTAPAVPLEHSEYISSIDCSDNQISISFNNKTAYGVVMNSWPTDGNHFILVGACNTNNATRPYHMITGVTHDEDNMTAHCQSQEIGIKDACHGGTVVWGNYEPSNAGTVPYLTSTGAVTSSQPTYSATVLKGSSYSASKTASGSGAGATSASFDQLLDDALGYEDLDTEVKGFFQQLLVSPLRFFRRSMPTRLRTRRSSKRSWWDDVVDTVSDAADDVVSGVEDVASDVATTVVDTATDVVDTAVDVATDVVDTVESAVDTAANVIEAAGELIVNGEASLSFPLGSLSISLPPDGTFDMVDTPWDIQGFVVESFDNGTLWCIDCVVTGSIAITGSAEFSITDGLTTANVNVDGALHVGFELGLQATYEWDKTFSKDFYSVNLAGLEIPEIISVGPMLSLSGEFTVSATAEGQLRAGFALDWTAAHAALDLLDPSSSDSTGWDPVYTPVFDASGEVTIGATLSTPVTLSFGINILDGLFTKSVGVVESPSIYATGTFAAQITLNDDGTISAGVDSSDSATGTSCLGGINLEAGIANQLYLEVDDDNVFTLSDMTWPAFQDCINLGLSGNLGDDGDDTTTDDSNSSTVSTNDTDISDIVDTVVDAIQAISGTSGTTTATPTAVVTVTTSTEIFATTASTVEDITSAQTTVEILTTVDSHGHATTETLTVASTTVFETTVVSTILSTSDVVATATVTPLNAATPAVVTGSAAPSSTPAAYTITSSDSSTSLSPDDDGNLYAVAGSASSTFVSLGGSGYAVGDVDEQRILHYYQASLASYGVSRLRLHPSSHCPVSSVPVAFTDKVSDSLTAYSYSGDTLYPITCTVDGKSKIFLATDTVNSLQTLMKTSLQSVLTGGVVSSCQYIKYRIAAVSA